MLNLKQLRKDCAGCSETSYEKCKTCQTHSILNKPCVVCKALGAIEFAVSRKGKLSTTDACPSCIELLT